MQRNDDQGKKTKKRRPKRDGAYNPSNRQGKRRKATSGNAIHMRTTNKKTYTDANGIEKPLKMSALIHENSDTPKDISTAVKERFATRNDAIPFNTPIGKITKVNPVTQSPYKAISKNTATKVYRSGKYGEAVVFSSDKRSKQRSPSKQQTTLSSVVDFKSTAQYEAIKETAEEIKYKKVRITKDIIEKAKKQHIKNGSRRPVSQYDVMTRYKEKYNKEHNATEYVHATTLFPDKPKCEWLHLIAYSLIGAMSQDVDNLTAGTFDANTEMMFLEGQLNKLVNKYPEGIELEVTVNLIPHTHIATNIEYNIITPDFTLKSTFDGQNRTKPHIVKNEYVKNYVETLTEVHQEKTESKKRKRSSSVNTSQAFFKSTELSSQNETSTAKVTEKRPTKRLRK